MTQTAVTSMRFACRRRTAAGWTTSNEVLYAGEIGVETDTRKFKFGDGVTAWNSLLYAGGGSSGGASAWGDITGTLADQLDLQAALDLKVPTSRTVNGHALSANVTLSAADVGADASGSASSAQAYAVQRANHTGTQAQSTITNLVSDLAAKADLVGGVVPSSQIPAIAITEYLGSVSSQAAMLALSGQKGDWAIRSDLSMVYIITGNDPTQLSDWTGMAYPTAPVLSVNGLTGAVTLAKSDIGLGNVENTALSTWAGSSNLTTLGTIATGVWSGTAIAVANGGTGATDASGARTALGLAIGSQVQAYSASLAAIAGLTPNADDVLQFKSGAWTNRSVAQLASDLGVPTLDGTNIWNAQNTFAAGTITTSQPFTVSQTWNDSGVTFIARDLQITSAASAAASLADRVQVGGSTIYSLDKTGVILVGAGAIGAPAYSFVGDSDTGIYNPSANALNLVTGGTARISISGSAGITFGGSLKFNQQTVSGLMANVVALVGPTTSTQTAADTCRYLYNTSSSTGLTTVNLPSATVSLFFEFACMDTDGIKIVAATGDEIRVIDKVTATGGYIQSNTVGSRVRLVSLDSTTWISDPNGVWTDGTFTYDDTSLTTP